MGNKIKAERVRGEIEAEVGVGKLKDARGNRRKRKHAEEEKKKKKKKKEQGEHGKGRYIKRIIICRRSSRESGKMVEFQSQEVNASRNISWQIKTGHGPLCQW